MNVYLDIETLPTDLKWVKAQIRAGITAPATHKKPESIAEWHKEFGEQVYKDKLAKTALNGLYGRICCIGFAIDDNPPVVISNANEKQLLNDFFYTDELQICSDFKIIGHNVIDFDIPFIKHRSIINNVSVNNGWGEKFKKYSIMVKDTMTMWSNNYHDRVGLDDLCKVLGIEGKGDMDGSKVAETWEKDKDKVIKYCGEDVVRTREIYKRLIKVMGVV